MDRVHGGGGGRTCCKDNIRGSMHVSNPMYIIRRSFHTPPPYEQKLVRGRIQVKQGSITPPQPPAGRRAARREVGQTWSHGDVVIKRGPRIADGNRRRPLDSPAIRRSGVSTQEGRQRSAAWRYSPSRDLAEAVLVYISLPRLGYLRCSCVVGACATLPYLSTHNLEGFLLTKSTARLRREAMIANCSEITHHRTQR